MCVCVCVCGRIRNGCDVAVVCAERVFQYTLSAYHRASIRSVGHKAALDALAKTERSLLPLLAAEPRFTGDSADSLVKSSCTD